jgi:hypothetical protein
MLFLRVEKGFVTMGEILGFALCHIKQGNKSRSK